MANQKFRYASCSVGDDHSVIRQAEGENAWDEMCGGLTKDKARDLVDDLNLAQRIRPTLEPGQEIRKK